MVIIEMTRPSTITGICKRSSECLEQSVARIFPQAVRARLRARTAFRLHTDQPFGLAQCLIR
jgi:hypothetical protein